MTTDFAFRSGAEQGIFPFELVEYGHSVEGVPLRYLPAKKEARLLVFAAIHGEESETTFLLSRALRKLFSAPDYVACILTANPDGMLRGTRCNANGVDLNRNFPTSNWKAEKTLVRLVLEAPRETELSTGSSAGSEPETQALIALIQKLGVKKELLKEYDEKLEKLNEQVKAKDKDVQKSLNIILSVIFIVLSAIVFYINKLAGLLTFGIFIAIYLPVILIRKNSKNQEEKLKQKEIKNLRKSKLEKETEIEETEKTICDNVNREMIENVNNTGLRTLDLKTVENRIAQEEQNLSNSKIHLNTIEIEEKRIGQDLEKKVEIEEALEKTLEEKNDLETEERRIKLAKEMLEQAYIKMKNEITPKFTSNLSKIASKISNNKYSNIKFNDNDGLTVELENGEYVKCDRLSTGTIEQLYLALRLSAFEEITEEKIPIILDEAFAYYDNIRLENILSYLNNYYTDNQILIFTCTDREKQILDRLKIEYNFIKL